MPSPRKTTKPTVSRVAERDVYHSILAEVIEACREDRVHFTTEASRLFLAFLELREAHRRNPNFASEDLPRLYGDEKTPASIILRASRSAAVRFREEKAKPRKNRETVASR